jgi:hypothetical protein
MSSKRGTEADGDFNRWFYNIAKYVNRKTADPAAWTHIPPGEVEALIQAYREWAQDYRAVDSRSWSPELEKTLARAVAESELWMFINRWLMVDPVIDEERVEMGLPLIRGQEKTPAPAPKLYPRTGFFRRQIIIPCQEPGEEGPARPPEGVGGIEVKWAFLESAAGDPEKLANSVFSVHDRFVFTPLILSFQEHEEGKQVCMAGRWIFKEGARGPFGELESVVVP